MMKLFGKKAAKEKLHKIRLLSQYSDGLFSDDDAVRMSLTVERNGSMHYDPALFKVQEKFYIGGSESFCDHYYADCRSIFARVADPREEPIFWLSDLSHVEDREYVESAPKIALHGFNWGTSDLVYHVSDYPCDDLVYANQKAAFRGEIKEIKLFAVVCRMYGMIECYFYNEMTQQLSSYMLQYTDRFPIVLRAERGLARYLIVYVSDRVDDGANENHVWQYVDDDGKKVALKTHLELVLHKKQHE